jgi:leader peptidase (prepilin peptidase) / N-methyltransferase
MIRVLGTVFAAMLGLAFGSFLNVCLSRWPEGESIIHPRSHCRRCGRILAWWENVPLVSWIALRGRCRGCGAWIGWRYVLVECAVAAVWSLLAWRSLNDLLLSPESAIRAVEFAVAFAGFFWILIALAVLDGEHLWLPDFLTIPGIVLGLLLNWFFWARGNQYFRPDLSMRPFVYRVLGVLAAAALVLLIRWGYWLIRRREGIGLGDAKLMALLAAWLGLPRALLSFGIGVLLGALLAFIVLLVPRREAEERWGLLKLPLGTFLGIGGIVSGLWGQQIIAAYRNWAGF